MTPERLIATFCAAHGGDFKSMSRATGERFTAADAAMACSAYVNPRGSIVRLTRAAEYAFRYRWAGDHSCAAGLRECLLDSARSLHRREQWPKKIPRLNPDSGAMEAQPYLEDLVELAMLEEQCWWLLKKHGLWYVVMRVQPFVWRRTLSGRYEALRDRLDNWCSDARYHIRRKLRHAPEE